VKFSLQNFTYLVGKSLLFRKTKKSLPICIYLFAASATINMQKTTFLFGLFFFLIPSFLVAQQGVTSWILDRMQSHSPSSLQLLKSYDKLPSQLEIDRGESVISSTKSTDALYYLEDENYESALISMSTNVHEIGHAYGGLIHFAELMNCNCIQTIEFEDIQQGFYHAPGEEYWIEIEEGYIFPSNELSETIPYELQTFRYDTYIEGTSSTQAHGVIGLLDELNAYYLGSKYQFDMLPVYKEVFGSDYLNQWVKHSASEMEYLFYAKNNAPATYNYLKNSPAFRKAYQTTHKKYSQLTSAYVAKIEAEKNYAELNYDSPFWEDDYERLKERLDSGVFKIIELDFLK
jgi:hypothetical protein